MGAGDNRSLMPNNTISETHPGLDAYLDGDQFSDTYPLDVSPFTEAYDAHDRQDTLEDLYRGKRVLHLGCTDHLGLIDDRIAAGRHLHARLSKTTADCIGIDIDDESIEYLRARHSIDNIIKLDILADELPEQISSKQWDYIVLGEILEHVDNPVEFLSQLKDRFASCCDSIMITVPNAFGLAATKQYRNNRIEMINSDHRYWFSPFTLLKVMRRAGFSPDSLIYADPPGHRWPVKLINLVLGIVGAHPLASHRANMASTLIGISRLSGSRAAD